MKTTSVFLLLSLLVPVFAQADQHLRIWRGVARSDMTRVAVEEAVRNRLAPMTTEVGAGQGLAGYVPAIPFAEAGISDEVALIIYDSETAYRTLRATPGGQAYGKAHGEMFDMARSSSLVAGPMVETIEMGKAYNLWGGDVNWRRGMVRVSVMGRVAGTTDAQYLRGVTRFLDQVAELNADVGMEALVIGVDAGQITMFEKFRDVDTLEDVTLSQAYLAAERSLQSVTTRPALVDPAIRQRAGGRVEIPTGGAVQLVW